MINEEKLKKFIEYCGFSLNCQDDGKTCPAKGYCGVEKGTTEKGCADAIMDYIDSPYSGKVVCKSAPYMHIFEAGKIYIVTDGIIETDQGIFIPHRIPEKFEDMDRVCDHVRFEEIEELK